MKALIRRHIHRQATAPSSGLLLLPCAFGNGKEKVGRVLLSRPTLSMLQLVLLHGYEPIFLLALSLPFRSVVFRTNSKLL
jgi:hypothetical protein